VLAEWLSSLFKRQLGLGTSAKADIEKVLEKPDFDSVVKFIKSGQCKNIVTMAGAGISTCKYFSNK
jgi:NAD-dependent deacetylase sirtuin 2